MLSLTTLLLSTLLNAEPQCDFPIQIAHVQQATSRENAFSSFEISDLADLIPGLIDELKEYFIAVDYAVTSFRDKPVQVLGIPETSWQSESNDDPDYCYRLEQGMTDDTDSLRSVFSDLVAAGGNDFMENQWDALYRTAVDPSVGWTTPASDPTALRIAMLVTDSPAHTASETFKDEPRNWSYEIEDEQGPCGQCDLSGPLNSTSQSCDLASSMEDQEIYNNFAHRVGEDHCFGRAAPRSGTLRSYRYSLGYFKYYYPIGDVVSGILNDAYYASSEAGTTYRSFIQQCSAMAGLNFFQVGSLTRDDVESVDCQTFGGRFYFCDVGGIASYCFNPVYPDASPDPSFWSGIPGEQTEESWESLTDMIQQISDYPYEGSFSAFDDCTKFEYPDPSSSSYADVFLKNEIMPVVIAALPTNEYKQENNMATDIEAYDKTALLMSAMNCPNLEYDPWLAISNVKDLQGVIGLYPTADSWTVNEDGEYYFETEYGCNDQNCADKWWQSCYSIEYGLPVDAVKSNGVDATLKVLQADYNVHHIIEAIKEAVFDAAATKGCTIQATTAAPSTDDATTYPLTDLPTAEDKNMGIIIGSSIIGGSAAAAGVGFVLFKMLFVPMKSRSSELDIVDEDVNVATNESEREQFTDVADFYL